MFLDIRVEKDEFGVGVCVLHDDGLEGDSVVWERIGKEGSNLKKYWNSIRES